MKIPKKFKLFGTTINVVWDTEKMDREDALGVTEYVECSITLTKVYKGDKLTDDAIMDTYYHERVHAILHAMHEYKLSSNEKFVEVFSRLLRQSDETAEY